MNEKKVILMDSPEAATEITIPAWKSASGRIYTDEYVARYDGCTHRKCEYCGVVYEKRHTACGSCRAKIEKEAFMALPVVEWNGKDPICIYNSGQYFFKYDDLMDYCEQEEVDKKDLMLVLCEPMELRTLDSEFFADYLADGQELPAEIEEAIEEFNAKIATYPQVISWVPTRKRIEFKYGGIEPPC